MRELINVTLLLAQTRKRDATLNRSVLPLLKPSLLAPTANIRALIGVIETDKLPASHLESKRTQD